MAVKIKDQIFKYSRAEGKYSVDVIVRGSMIVYANVVLPAGTTKDVRLKLFEDAERAVIAKLDKDIIEGQYGSI